MHDRIENILEQRFAILTLGTAQQLRQRVDDTQLFHHAPRGVHDQRGALGYAGPAIGRKHHDRDRNKQQKEQVCEGCPQPGQQRPQPTEEAADQTLALLCHARFSPFRNCDRRFPAGASEHRTSPH